MSKEKLLRDILDELGKTGFYNIMCAIRGPDFSRMWAIKHIFTARIRYILFGSDIPGSVRDTPYIDKLEAREALKWVIYYGVRDSDFNDVIVHYLGHVQTALSVLRIYFNSKDPELAEELLKLEKLAHSLMEVLGFMSKVRILEYFNTVIPLLETDEDRKIFEELKKRVAQWFEEKKITEIESEETASEFIDWLEDAYEEILLASE